jgi:hypothetical protein
MATGQLSTVLPLGNKLPGAAGKTLDLKDSLNTKPPH